MALKLKYTDEHGILHVNMSPSSTTTGSSEPPNMAGHKNLDSKGLVNVLGPIPDMNDQVNVAQARAAMIGSAKGAANKAGVIEGSTKAGRRSPVKRQETDDVDINDPQFDTINNRFAQYDLFGGKYDCDSGGETRSLFRSRYNSIEEELANTPYAFRGAPLLDITIERTDVSPSKDLEDNRFFKLDLFGPTVPSSDESETPAFTVTQLIHAQDRYFDLSSRQSSVSAVSVVKDKDDAFKVLSDSAVKGVQTDAPAPVAVPVVPTSKRKREKSFAILTETPSSSRPSSPRSLPVEIRVGRISPFKGRGFREETSRHSTPKTSAANSRANSPLRRRTSSLSRIDSMAATLPPQLPPIQFSSPHTPRDFVKENIEEIRELSELNREKHEAEAEKKKLEEEEALLKEMGLLDKNAKSDAIRSVVCSRTNSRSNSPTKIRIRSRSNSPSTMVLKYENVPEKRFINEDDGMAPVTHRSRMRSVSKSQPQSNDGSPKHSKIPKRQSSVSPNRNLKKPLENGLKNQRFISNSTSSIHESIRVGSQAHDKRNMSRSTQLLNITPAVKGKPPISPGRGGPPPSNRAINSKRLSPIVGTPNKSPTEDPKSPSARNPTKSISTARKPVKSAANNPATSRLNSRQPSRGLSRDPSPDKRRTFTKPSTAKPPTNVPKSRPVARAASTRTTQKPTVNKTEPKKPVSRTNSMKTLTRTINVLTRTPSTKTLNEKPPVLKKRDSKKELKVDETDKTEPVKAKSPTKSIKEITKTSEIKKEEVKEEAKNYFSSSTEDPPITTQDNETQYDKITNEKGELVIMTKKNIVSMTTAAITSQPLEVVTKVTNQLPVALEKAREKGIFERHSSKDSLAPKNEDSDQTKPETKDAVKEKAKTEEEKEQDDKKSKFKSSTTVFIEDNVRLRPLLPPYNNPQVERVKQRIDDILKSPEVSAENIASVTIKPIKERERSTFKNLADKTKNDLKDSKDETAKKFSDLKEQILKQKENAQADVEQSISTSAKVVDNAAEEIRTEASKIVDSIMTPVEEPKPAEPPKKEEPKKDIEPIVMVVNEKNNGPNKTEVTEKMTETLIKAEPEVEVQGSNISTSGVGQMASQNKQMSDGNGSDKSTHSNGGFPQSTSTTPKPPARTKKETKDDKDKQSKTTDSRETTPETKPQNLCQRLIGKCKKCCQCCVRGDGEKEMEDENLVEEKRSVMSRLNCCKKSDKERDIEKAADKAASIAYESETKRKRKFRDVMCGCCGNRRRISDVSQRLPSDVTQHELPPSIVGDTGCCGRRKLERRDSILSDRPPNSCCNNRFFTWIRGCCRRHQSEQLSASRRQSLFSKNKSLSPTLPPEDNRTKLDASLVEHTSMMRGAVPVLPIVLAYFCLINNIIVPGLGTIFSGMFCLCFGIPRFGVHDGAKYRIGSFIINLLVGCGQLFTVLFCLVGWGWSIWWGVIMVKISRKYRKLKAEEAAQEAEAPPVTANNHTRT